MYRTVHYSERRNNSAQTFAHFARILIGRAGDRRISARLQPSGSLLSRQSALLRAMQRGGRKKPRVSSRAVVSVLVLTALG